MTDRETHDDYAGALPEAELEEVWSLFAEDGREAVNAVEETLLELESTPTDAGQVARLFRGLHTFKGNARMMGLDVIESLAHHAEDLVALVRDEGVALTGAMIDLLLEVLDHLRIMLDHAMTYRRDVEAAQVEGLMAKLRDMLAEHPEQAPSLQDVSFESVAEVAPVDTKDVSASRSEDDMFILVEELVDPATDPEYVRIFMEMAESEMRCLHAALDALADGSEGEEEDGIQEIKAVVDTLTHAAGRMGYERLVAMLNELGTIVKDWDGEARVAGIERLELALSQELAAIQGVAPSTLDAPSASGQAQPPELKKSVKPPSQKRQRDRLAEQLQITVGEALAMEQSPVDEDMVYKDILSSSATLRAGLESSQRLPQSPQPSQPPQPLPGFGEGGMAIADLPDVTQLFRRWCESRMLADLARLGEVMDDLEQFVKQFLVGGSALAWDEGLVNKVAYLLRGIYHSCVFNRLDQGTRTTLALEDLYTRVAGGEMALNAALLDLTRTYATQMSSVVEAAYTGKTPDTATLADLLSQAEEMLHLHTEGHVRQVTKDILNLLDLPPEFEEVMTSENILDVSRALQAGKGFYTVLADLNQQEEIGQVFYEWSRLNSVHLITNVTVFRDEHTLFNFLLATFESLEAVQGAFAEMDPQGRYLSLEKCTLRDGVDLKEAVSVRPVQPVFRQTERTVETGSTVSADALAGFVENVGELVTTRATLHHVTQRLTEMNLVETVTRLVKQSDGDWQRVRKELQTSLEVWADDLDALSRAENELGMALDQFQETALALRARPAAEILDPLQRLVQEVAQHLGKIVELDVTGVDVGLDHSALDVLADPVRRLVWFAVAHSIEKPVQRREAGKPTVGRVSVVVRKTADRAHVVIKDDGCGIDPDAVLNRARELGWTNGDSISAGKLSEWVLKNGFGVVGGSYDVEGIDLVAISAELQAHRGWLNVVSEPGQSTRFSLDVPLDMVVIDGMVMRVGDVRYVVPIEAIRRIVKPEENQIVRSSADGSQSMLRLEEELVPIQILRQGSGQVLIKGQRENFSRAGLLLVVEQNEQSIALAVDELIGQQQVLIQPLQGRLADVQGISGCALLGEGDVGMVLDLNRMNV